MANVGENFTSSIESGAFTNSLSDGRSNASLDYYQEAMNGFFTKLQDTLSQAGINLQLPQLDIFDSGNSQNCRSGDGSSGGASNECSTQTPQERPPAQPEPTPTEPAESTTSRLPYNRKELGGQMLLDNFDQIDLDGDGFLRKAEVQDYKRSLNGRLEKASVEQVLDDFTHVKNLSNDQRGEEIGVSCDDLERMVDNIQQRGKLHGYPTDR